MDHAIHIIDNEIRLLEKCLSEWESTNHPEAKKGRDKKLKDLKEAKSKILAENPLDILKESVSRALDVTDDNSKFAYSSVLSLINKMKGLPVKDLCPNCKGTGKIKSGDFYEKCCCSV